MKPCSVATSSGEAGSGNAARQLGQALALGSKVRFHFFMHVVWYVCPQQRVIGRLKSSAKQMKHVFKVCK